MTMALGVCTQPAMVVWLIIKIACVCDSVSCMHKLNQQTCQVPYKCHTIHKFLDKPNITIVHTTLSSIIVFCSILHRSTQASVPCHQAGWILVLNSRRSRQRHQWWDSTVIGRLFSSWTTSSVEGVKILHVRLMENLVALSWGMHFSKPSHVLVLFSWCSCVIKLVL